MRGRRSTATAPTIPSPRTSAVWTSGFVRESGAMVSAGDATEFFQLVEKAEGALYWLDLDRLLTEPVRPLDVARARALGAFLARAHATRRDEPTLYERRIRELVGHGECLMGILDSYPHPYALLPPHVCEALEHDAVSWRWRLRGRAPPAGLRARRFPSVEPPVPGGNRLLGAGPEPGGVGRAGRRRERARDQLPLLRAPEGRPRDPAWGGRAVRHALPRVPRRLRRRVERTASCSR